MAKKNNPIVRIDKSLADLRKTLAENMELDLTQVDREIAKLGKVKLLKKKRRDIIF